jgi:hypothetical protein
VAWALAVGQGLGMTPAGTRSSGGGGGATVKPPVVAPPNTGTISGTRLIAGRI